MSSSALVLAAVAVTQVAAAAKWNIGNFKPRAEVAVEPNGRLPEVELDAALHSSLLALRLVEKAAQGATPEEAMAEAQKLLDADDQHDANIWKHAVLSLGGSQAEADEIAKPIRHSLTEKGDGDEAEEGPQDGDYVLLLMQHDLQQLDLAQSAFADALTVSEDTVKEIAPHVKLYDDWTRLHGGLVQLHGSTANADNGTIEASQILEGLGGADRAARNFTANATAAAATDEDAGSADGENVLRLMEHDMALLQRAENEYSNAIGTMERTAAEVKKHEDLYADFVKALQEHAKKSSKLTLGNSVNGPAKKVDLAEVKQLVSAIAKATAFCQDAAVKAKKAQEDGTAPPVSKLLDQTRQLWAGAMALMEANAKPQQQAAALMELRALADPSSEAAKATKERVLHKIRSEQPDAGSSPDDQLAQDVDKADGIVADVTTAERHMKESLGSITPP